MRRALIPITTLMLAGAACSGTPASTGGWPAPHATEGTAPPPTATGVPGAVLAVPAGPAPVVDGSIGPDEWAGAAVTPMSDGTEVLWLHAEGSLYAAVRSTEMAAVNLFLADPGRVRVLQSSASLGSAEYAPVADGSWDAVHGFAWCCAAPGRAAADLFEREGWASVSAGVGVIGETEFRVVLGSEPLRVAVARISMAEAVAYWPADLSTGQQAWMAVTGDEPAGFDPAAWVQIVPEG